MMLYDKLTCGTCGHWHPVPAAVEILGKKNGECREGPPQIAMVPNQGTGELVTVVTYPITAENFPACARWVKPDAT
ncbi:MAG: hypothetical protein ACREI9_13230 [Nitrospiraceae bacterium]